MCMTLSLICVFPFMIQIFSMNSKLLKQLSASQAASQLVQLKYSKNSKVKENTAKCCSSPSFQNLDGIMAIILAT